MPRLDQKKISRIVRIRTSILKRMKDRFYIMAIVFIIIGILVLDYSYIEPKPYNDYVFQKTFSVNITNETNFYTSSFPIGGQFSSNISFSNPNGTPFTYRLFYITAYRSYGIPVFKNQTFQEANVSQTNFTSPLNTYGASYSLSLIITTNAPHLHIVVTELSWFVTRNQSDLFLDEIGTPFIIAGLVTIVARLTYNTSSRTKERNLAKRGSGNRLT